MPKAQPKSPDLLALAMRRARDDIAAGRVPKRPPEAGENSAPESTATEATDGSRSASGTHDARYP